MTHIFFYYIYLFVKYFIFIFILIKIEFIIKKFSLIFIRCDLNYNRKYHLYFIIFSSMISNKTKFKLYIFKIQ